MLRATCPSIRFGFWIGIAGLLPDKNCQLIYSAIDRQVVHGIARSHRANGGAILELSADGDGIVKYEQLDEVETPSLLSWQATNRESGAQQSFSQSRELLSVFADMTASY